MKKRSRRKDAINCFEAVIIGGDLKGKKILIPNLNTTRSSKSILRESLFNTLQFDIVDKNFVEVFAGSGSIGLEALSRGAKRCFFIEKNPAVHALLKENIQRVSAKNTVVLLGNSFKEFESVHKMVQEYTEKTYFYFDPPFSIREGMEEIYDQTISLIETIEAKSCEMVIIEHLSSVKLPDNIGSVSLKKKKRFGKSTLSYYSPV